MSELSPRIGRATRVARARTATSVLAAAVVLVAAACGGAGATAPERGGDDGELSLLLDYFPNADHAPIYAAQASGAFDRAGLEVAIRQPADPSAPIKQVAAGRVELAISYEPEVLRARSEGLPVTAVAALVQEPLTSLISLPRAGIDEPEDLAGKTVGTAGIDYQSAFLTAILDRAGIDRGEVEERNLGFNLVPGIVSGRADAVLGAFWNYEGTDLRLQGRDPRVIRIEQAGVPPYDELVLVANEQRLEREPAPVRAFIAALARGNERLQADPEAGLDALLAANPDLDRELQAEVVDVTLELFEPPAGKPYGWLDPRAWRRFAGFMADAGLIEPDAVEGAYTNELLPRRRRSGGPDA